MTVRGEFVRGDGLVLPNNVTPHGRATILRAVFQNLPTQYIVGLGDAIYRPDILESEVNEPNAPGYGRLLLPRDSDHWPVVDNLNGEVYVESLPFIFGCDTAEGYAFSRLILFDQGRGNIPPGRVLAMSAAAPAPLRITTFTPEPERTFKYRLYLG